MRRGLMFMGTGSDVGKSLIVAGLARAYTKRGLKIMPFKPQNMSNNAAVTTDGGEIGRAQALQARAAGQQATVHMNPLLLKPEGGQGAQIIVQGQKFGRMTAKEFFQNRAQFMPAILESYHQLYAQADLVLVEGAGSPAEINLRRDDLANMGFARAANIAGVLVGDIHRGGVIASIIGTMAVLDPDDRAVLKAFIINKFHGDVNLFSDGVAYIRQHTNLLNIGIVPHFPQASLLPAEDSLALENPAPNNPILATQVVVLRLPHIANFDDFDPLRQALGDGFCFIERHQPIPSGANLVIIPGSKSTIADLAALRAAGWDIDLHAHLRRGGHILGICGGYQMLGQSIHDPDQTESTQTSVAGLGFLQVETTLTPQKTLVEVTAQHVGSNTALRGYEIHLGTTKGPDCARPFSLINGRPEGASSANGLVKGTYVHGCFSNDDFRRHYLGDLAIKSRSFHYENQLDDTLDALALHLETALDLDTLLALARS